MRQGGEGGEGYRGVRGGEDKGERARVSRWGGVGV